MPIEISEIGISISVREPDGTAASSSGPVPDDEQAREALIEECVRRTLQVLKMERDR